jgi:hypothetical protein
MLVPLTAISLRVHAAIATVPVLDAFVLLIVSPVADRPGRYRAELAAFGDVPCSTKEHPGVVVPSSPQPSSMPPACCWPKGTIPALRWRLTASG